MKFSIQREIYVIMYAVLSVHSSTLRCAIIYIDNNRNIYIYYPQHKFVCRYF